MKNTFNDKDFTYSMFPINRKKQFGFVLKNNWKRFLLLGFILLLFSLPLIISLLIKDIKAAAIVSNNESDLVTKLFTNELFFGIFIVPSFAILFLGLSGLFRVLRNYVWSEGILIKEDYIIGLKQNWLVFVLVGLIFSLFYYLSYFISASLNVTLIRYLPFALYILLIIPVSFVGLSMTSIYKNSFSRLIVNSFKIYVKKLLYFFVSELVILSIPVVLLILPMPLILKYVILVLFIFGLLPIMCFAFQLISMHIFDELINKENHKEIYKKGLYH